MFCSNCGKQINDGAVFCHECGQKVGGVSVNQPVAINQPSTPKKQVQVLDKAKGVFEKIKKFRLPSMNVDYSSKAFKFAMIILLSLELGDSLEWMLLAYSDTYYNFTVKSSLFSSILQLIFTIAFFGVLSAIAFLPLLLKLRNKFCKNRSSIVAICCGTFAVVKIVFTVLSEDYLIQKWFLEPTLITYIVEVLLVISIVIFLFKNRPKNILIPASLMLIHWLPAGVYSSFHWINLSINSVKLNYLLDKATLAETILDWSLEVLSSYYIPILIILFLITRYLFSHKTSKGIVIGMTVFVFIMDILDMVLNSSFSLSSILGYVNYIARLLFIILFALSMIKTKAYENNVQEKTSFKTVFKRGTITSIISIATAFVLILSGLIVSGVVTASYINKNIEQWTAFAKIGHNATQEQWDEFTSSVSRSDNLLLTKNFIEYYDYENYEKIKENYNTMEDVVVCYNAYCKNSLNDEMISDINYIGNRINEDWQTDEILGKYYNLYQEMQPDIDDVYVSVQINTNTDKIIATVTNKNELPLSSCTINYDFTLLYVPASSYSDIEYGDGSRTITVEDIPANYYKTVEISFDPNSFYDGYGYYHLYSVWKSDAEIVSIK